MQEIEISKISSSPYQNRKKFHGIDELAESLQRDGLIHPVVVREVDGNYELVVGERRLKATATFKETITAIVKDYTNLEARRVVAAENMQRDNPSAIEEVEAIIGMVDAELFENAEYVEFADTPQKRVKYLLGKLDSDRRNNTEFFTHKFMGKIESIFTQLPRKKEWRSFYVNDLPMLNIDIEIQEISMDNKLNKAQTKSLSNLKKNAPEAFKDIVKNIDDDGVINMGVDDDGETITLQDTSAKEIKFEGFTSDVLATKNTGDEESYTPIDYIESARVVMNGICLDPASNQMAQINVKANNYYTVDDDGLTKEWGGKVWIRRLIPAHPKASCYSTCWARLLNSRLRLEQNVNEMV